MPDTTFTPNRRSFLGGGAFAAAAVSTPGTLLAAPSLSAWDLTMANYLATQARSDLDDDEALSSLASRLHVELMDMPAPNRTALRWKLERVLHFEFGDSTTSWSEGYVRQTIADYRRLLA